MMTINVENVTEVRDFARHIADAVGEDASAALREFFANVREHCVRKDVEVVHLPTALMAFDYGGGIRNPRTRKEVGEGGYGIPLMRAFGAELRNWDEGTMFLMFLPANEPAP